MLRRLLLKPGYRILVQFVNLSSNLLPDGRLWSFIRVALYGLLGNRVSVRSTIHGGSRICGGGLQIGNGTFINRNCYFDLTGTIKIGANCSIGHGASFITAEHELGPRVARAGKVNPKGVIVGDGVWIGANVTILPGVNIGDGAVIGAAALVTKDVPANAVVHGVPGKVVRLLE